MARRSRGRDVSGVLALDKPAGMTSNAAVQAVKRLFHARKVGHTGSLDPLATGVLPLCFGAATKLSQYLLNSDKRYLTEVRLGISTDSGDAEGKVIAERPVGRLSKRRVEAALDAFRGEVEQVPSMFSAIKHQGQPLYKLARRGVEVEREPRRVTIHSNELVAFDGDALTLDIHCSKGTYVRSIVAELGDALGCGAHVTALRRTLAGPFAEADLVTFDALEAADAERRLDALLLPPWSAVRDWPVVTLAANTAYYLRQGQAVLVPHAPTAGWVRLCEAPPAGQGDGPAADAGGHFLGVGEILECGRVAPRRLLKE